MEFIERLNIELNQELKEEKTCQLCGKISKEVHEQVQSTNSGIKTNVQCDNMVECWQRWDSQNGMV